MSNQYAIASVTRTIQYLLQQADVTVTTKTPDLAARDTGRRLNLFLYHTMHNAAWRNQDLPGRVRRGEVGHPPLAVNLYYLLTAYGEEGADLADQQMLGAAMRALHDRPILKADLIRRAVSDERELRQSDLADQVEKVRIVPEQLDIESMSRLWTTFQTQYRVSAAYQASVVLIESQRPSTSALPVTQRGESDRGVNTDVGLEPTLERIEYRGDPQEPQLPAAGVGATITLYGANLPVADLEAVVVYDPKVSDVDPLSDGLVATLQPEAAGTNDAWRIRLSEDAGTWRAGLLTMEVRYRHEGRSRSTNVVPLALAPELITSPAGDSVVAFIDAEGDRRLLTLTLAHPLGDKRKVLLTLNQHAAQTEVPAPGRAAKPLRFQIAAEPDAAGIGNLNPTFDVTNIPAGEYWVRLRVDGIDSLLVQKTIDPATGQVKVAFDPKQKVRL